MVNVLYIHGMGGGSDSRIPSILNEEFAAGEINVVARTYDFDPEVAVQQISQWCHELKPALIIGESLGALHALRICGIPRLFVSPALNAPYYFELMAWLSLIPGVTWIFDRIYRPREGDRQRLHFTFRTLRKYMAHRREALRMAAESNGNDFLHAFFGRSDHYLKSGVVSLKTWKKHFGDTFELYDGTHFMEEEYVRTILVAMVLNVLSNK